MLFSFPLKQRDRAERHALVDLGSKVDPARFEELYRLPLAKLDEVSCTTGVARLATNP